MGNINAKLRVIAFHSAIALLLFSTLFVSHYGFVEAHIVPKWYGFIAGVSMLALLYIATLTRRRINMSLSFIDISVGIFLGYLLLQMLTAGTPSITILALCSFIILYFLFKRIPSDDIRCFGIIVVCLCAAQALYGLGQWVGMFHAAGGFRMTGSFDNPAGLTACLAAGFPFCFSLLGRSKIQTTVGYICLGIIAIAVTMSGSRSGMLAIAIVSSVYMADKYRQLIKTHLKIVVIFLILFILFSIGLIFAKKDSTTGRVAIWGNSIEMIADKPLFGHGPGAFSSQYMLYQADYFTENPDTPYSQLADNVTHPFNEYLLLVVEYGMLGLLLLFLLIVVILRSARRPSIPILCLLSVAAFSCFSYPLRYPFLWVLVAYSLSALSKRSEVKNLKMSLRSLFIWPLLLPGSVTIVGCLIRDIRFEYEWGGLALRGGWGNNDKLIESYDSLHKRWNGDPLFLYNYGAILNQAERHLESNLVMSECERWLNDYDVQMIMGDNSFRMGKWGDAERHYLLASNMIPNRFMPLNCLMELYQITGNHHQVLEIAENIIVKEIKVPSGTVYNIIKKAERVIVEINSE